MRKEKEPSAVAADIEKEESSPSSVLEAVVTESIAKPLAPVFETMVTDQIEPLTPVSRTEIIHKHVEPSSPATESIPEVPTCLRAR